MARDHGASDDGAVDLRPGQRIRIKTGPNAGREGVYLGAGSDYFSKSVRSMRRRRGPAVRTARVEFTDGTENELLLDWLEPSEET